MAIDPAGGCYVAGTTLASDGSYDYLVLKYDSEGTLVWSRAYAGMANGWDEASGLAVDADSQIYVTGLSERPDTDLDFVTLHYASSGEVLHLWVYNGPDDRLDASSAVAIDGHGRVYLTGLSDTGGGVRYLTTVSVDSSFSVVDVQEESAPRIFAVRPLSANPARAGFLLELSLPEAGVVDLYLYDVQGRRAAEVLLHHALDAGTHRIPIETGTLPSGVYFYRLSGHLAGRSIAKAGKLTLLR